MDLFLPLCGLHKAGHMVLVALAAITAVLFYQAYVTRHGLPRRFIVAGRVILALMVIAFLTAAICKLACCKSHCGGGKCGTEMCGSHGDGHCGKHGCGGAGKCGSHGDGHCKHHDMDDPDKGHDAPHMLYNVSPEGDSMDVEEKEEGEENIRKDNDR